MFTIHQIFLCGILYWLAEANLPFVTLWTLQKPLVCGWAAGLVLGAPVQGALCGAVLSVILLGFSSAGSSMPIDLALTGITGAALTAAGLSPYAAVPPALLAGCAGKYIWKLRMQVNVRFARQVRSFIENGKTKEILLPAIIYPALFAAIVCLPVSTIVILLCNLLIHKIGDLSTVDELLGAAAGLLPAGGLAIALSAAGFRKNYPNKSEQKQSERIYTEEDPIETYSDKANPDEMDPDEMNPDEERLLTADSEEPADFNDPDQASPADLGTQTDTGKPIHLLSGYALTEAGLLWLLFLHICYNNEWMMGQAMAVVFLPLARKLRPGDREKQRTILLRQSRYFNTHCECGACIPGLMASMEEQLTFAPNEPTEKIDEILMVRTSLMGVCGALGDTLFQKHLIPLLLIAACLLTAVCPQQPTGPVLFTLLMTVLSFMIGLRSFFTGYHSAPEQLLLVLEKNVFRKVEKRTRILIAVLSIPGAFLFIRFPVKSGVAVPCSLTGLFFQGNAVMILLRSATALLLTAVSMICIRKLHWKRLRLYTLLSVFGIVLSIFCA